MDINGKSLTEVIVPYEIAIELKRLDFNEKCFAFYDEDKKPLVFTRPTAFYNNNNEIQYLRKFRNTFKIKKAIETMCLAPTWDQVTEWFLTKNMYVTYMPIFINRAIGLTEIQCYVPHCNFDYYESEYKTSKEAYTEAILTGIKILKDKSLRNGLQN